MLGLTYNYPVSLPNERTKDSRASQIGTQTADLDSGAGRPDRLVVAMVELRARQKTCEVATPAENVRNGSFADSPLLVPNWPKTDGLLPGVVLASINVRNWVVSCLW